MEDLIIIGAGPAGLTAAIYAARAGLKTLVLEGNVKGSQVALKTQIDSYPGFPQGISGSELILRFWEQARRWGARAVNERVLGICPAEGKNRVETEKGSYEALAVIIATGSRPAMLGIPGEEKLAGKDIFYSVAWDAAQVEGKKVMVIGESGAAIEEALRLSQHASEVVLAYQRDRLRVSSILMNRVKAEPKLRILLNAEAVAAEGENALEAVCLNDLKTKAETRVPAEWALVLMRQTPNTDFIKGVLPLDENGYILTNAWMATEVSGIYAAGDVRKKAFRQISTAVGDGTEGARAALRYISNL